MGVYSCSEKTVLLDAMGVVKYIYEGKEESLEGGWVYRRDRGKNSKNSKNIKKEQRRGDKKKKEKEKNKQAINKQIGIVVFP